MRKEFKDHHGNKHIHCDFGFQSFNKQKRDKEFVKATREKEKKERELQWIPVEVVSAPTEVTASGSDTEKPSTPQNLHVVSTDATSISIAWDRSTDNVAVLAYKVFFKKEGGHTFAVTTQGNVANFKKLDTNTTYYFYVRAVDTSKNLSDPTPTISAKTIVVPPPPPPVNTDWTVLYLDFNGGKVSGTSWNTSGDIIYEPSGMTISEEEAVIAGMAQDYFPWKVTVTNNRDTYEAANPMKRAWVIFTESFEWYCGSTTPCAGGVAFVGSMYWGSKTPCWIFTSALAYNSKYIRDAATHECGHTIGLYHQSVYDANCIKTAEYNPGNSTCDCSPNMGVAYYRTYNQWWVGPDSRGCHNIIDEPQFLNSKLGLK